MSEELSFIPFPTDRLPEVLARFVVEAAAAVGCDESYLAAALLPVVASAIGNTRRVRLKRDWTEPPVLWAAIVGNSGSMKSPAVRLVMRSVVRRQKTVRNAHQSELAAHADAMREWKAKPKDERGDEPAKPAAMEHVYCSDVTVEALADRLSVSDRGVLVAVDELAAWLASFNQYKGGGGADVPHWLTMHGADMLKVDRKSTDKPTLWVPHAAVCIVGGIQPKTLGRALTPEFFDNGLAARLLLTMPPPREKRWTDAEVSDATDSALAAVFDELYQYAGEQDGDGERRPTVIPLDEQARELFVAFVNEHAHEQAGLDDALMAVWSKLEACAARLALVFHCVRKAAGESVDPWHIDADSIAAGIAVARWFGNEARRIYADLAATDGERALAVLVGWIRDRGSVTTIRDLSHGPRIYREPGKAENALAALVEQGIGEWCRPAPGRTGGHPPMMFRLILRDGDTGDGDGTPRHDSASGGYGAVATLAGKNGKGNP